MLAFTGSVAVLAIAAVAFAALSQAGGGTAARLLTWALGTCVWAGFVGMALGVGPNGTPTSLPGVAWVAVAGVVLPAAALLFVAVARVGRLGRHDVAPGGTLAPGLSGALATLDLALGYDVLLAHRWNARAGVRPRRGGPSGPAALVWCDLTRLLRSPQTVVILAAAVVVPYAAESAGSGGSQERPRRTGHRAAALRPGRLSALHASLRVPWIDAVEISVAVGGCALAAAVRWVTGRPPDYSRPLVSTPGGAVPTNLYGSVLRGLDILLITAAPLLFSPTAGGALASLALTFAVVSYLVGRE